MIIHIFIIEVHDVLYHCQLLFCWTLRVELLSMQKGIRSRLPLTISQMNLTLQIIKFIIIALLGYQLRHFGQCALKISRLQQTLYIINCHHNYLSKKNYVSKIKFFITNYRTNLGIFCLQVQKKD